MQWFSLTDGENVMNKAGTATEAAERVRQCMRRGTRGAPDEYTWDEYKKALTLLLQHKSLSTHCHALREDRQMLRRHHQPRCHRPLDKVNVTSPRMITIFITDGL